MNKILSIALALMLVFTAVAVLSTKESARDLPPDSQSGVAQIGGAFTLINSNGEEISDSQFRGRYMLVFFGFTNCPDICPTTLATYDNVLAALKETAKEIAPVFITIDPKRDTKERLKEYMANFDSRIIALTGSEEQIKNAATVYKSYYAEGEGGMMNHSSLIYLMNRNGEYVRHFAYDTAPDILVAALREEIKP